MKKHDVIIIGAGPAGLSAAIYTARKELNTLIVCGEFGGQVARSWEIENYLGFGKTNGAEMVKKMREHIKLFDNIKLKEGVWVKDLKKNNNAFQVLTDRDRFEAEAVLIVTGSKPRKLGIPCEKTFTGKGVSYCSTCDAPLFKDKDVAVIGGGNSGLESALELSVIARHVYLLHDKEKLSGDDVLKKQVKSKDNVEIIFDAMTLEFCGGEGQLVEKLTYEDVRTKDKKVLDINGIFIEVGRIPATSFVKELVNLNKWNEIEVDENNMSSVKGFFAAGDVTGIREKQIVIAAGEGAKTALAIYDYLVKQKVEFVK